MSSRWVPLLFLGPATAFALMSSHLAPTGAKVRPAPPARTIPAVPAQVTGKSAASTSVKDVSAATSQAWDVLNGQLVTNKKYKDDVPQPNWLISRAYSKCDIWGAKGYGPCLHAKKTKLVLPPQPSPTSLSSLQSQTSPPLMEKPVQLGMDSNEPVDIDGPDSFVAFNQQAFDTITNNKMNDKATWGKAVASSAIRQKLQGAVFTKDAFILKAVVQWFTVPKECSAFKNSADCTKSIWAVKPDTVAAHRDVIANKVTNTQGVATQGQVIVDFNLDQRKTCNAKTTYTVQAQAAIGDRQRRTLISDPQNVVPLSCFYFVVFPSFPPHDVPTTSNQIFAEQPAYKAGDVIVIIMGFHLIRGGDPNWTWNTYWWTPGTQKDDPAHCTPAKTGPASKLPWNHYCADQAAAEEPLQKGIAVAHYNPYIEQFVGGSQSNCVHCHSRAMYRDTTANNGAKSGYTHSDFAQGKDPTVKPLVPCPPNSSSCPGGVSTHFLWSLANHFDDKNKTTTNQH